MLNGPLQPNDALRYSGRLAALTLPNTKVTAGELAVLTMAGTFAALAVQLISLELRIPGSAILRAALPVVLGFSLVPRRFAGAVMSVAAGITLAAMALFGVAVWQPAAITGLLALGPSIDLALAGLSSRPWRLYVRFVLGGIMANSLAFAVRAGAAWLALDEARPHRIGQFGLGVFLSFAACGALAGLLAAAICFHSGAHRAGALNAET